MKFPYREAVGALMWMVTMAQPDIACEVRAVARIWKNSGLVHYAKDGDVGHTLPASQKRVGDHVR